MRLLTRSLKEFTYTACNGKTEVLKNGKHTGKFEVSYGAPVHYKGSISVPSGQDQQTFFGINMVYTHVLLMDKPDADINEDGLIQWDGNVYEIKAIRPSDNVLAIALRKRTAGEVNG